ncbi:MAG: hypothetical protein ACREFQ_07260, partial [Stellaceae bacterium]
AWVAAFYFWLSMPLGALALLLIWDLTGGKWEQVARVPMSAMAATMPLFVLLFLPIIAGMHDLYSWTRPEAVAHLHNRWYLNSEFFFIRAASYFVIWNGFMVWRLLRPTMPNGVAPPGLQWVSAIGIMLMGYSVTFASIDWLMSTEPDWFSSIYGMVAGSGQFIASLALALVLIAAAAPPRGLARQPFESALASLCTLLVAVLIFWAYTTFCQWLIIWEENIRSEIGWYLERWRGAWASVIYTLAGAHFAIPFATLVWTPTKRKPGVVASVCVLLILANLVQIWWLFLPSFHSVGFSWLHPVVAIGMGGLWFVLLAILLRLLSALPHPRERAEGQLIHG